MLLFFDFGSGEIILIILVLFVVLGPQRLPEVARTLGKTINEMKRASAGFKNEINKEVQRIERETRYSEFLEQRNQQQKPDDKSIAKSDDDDFPAENNETKNEILLEEKPLTDKDIISDTTRSVQ
ncbi:MAG: twin-arginine translocase TatA/TatE family subunit [Bacteroidales bacterium]|nr:twin-arginine translocase TatA/TatE family subunit [Bacteroidales bacterium]